MTETPDMIIVGAGLSGLLTAWRCLDVNPGLTIEIVEASDQIAGDHTWSFNLTDVAPDLQDWIKPFIAYQWDRYDVKFPKRERTLDIPYCTGNSETLRACVQPHIESGRLQVRLNTRVETLSPDHVVLGNGEKLSATCVLDARGFEPNNDVFLGYQKFVGHVIKTETPHGVERPIIMDATVEQLGGYRFVYCLPYSETELLVEDTYYTDGPDLQSQEVDARIKDYIRDRLRVDEYEVVRREKGVLPITLAVKKDAYYPPAIGIRGGFFHAVTGYSFPDALKNAYWLAWDFDCFKNFPDEQAEGHIYSACINLKREKYKSERFLRLLNRMLFRAAKPTERYSVLQRFYGLNQGLIERFYGGTLTWRDKARILIGKPPVPVSKALYNFSESAFIRRERKKDAP
ncbi:lycopene beta-cyclase CrtY [Litorimonas sp. WD9-15]|uniref:lycopene beta-cyclase CrtY n=1 Tax=Litorimonas sp. WD9-15 TaxID=3418716 RepID=UPI003D01E891